VKNPDQLWLEIVNRFAIQSRCQCRQVGAILVDRFGHLFAQGWNSAPKGSSCEDCPRCKGKVTTGQNLEQAICVHAEINAIAHAARAGHATDGATLYCTTLPCAECAKAIVSAGIVEVVYLDDYPSPLTLKILNNAMVKLRKF
jgi:dCMP deaminase